MKMAVHGIFLDIIRVLKLGGAVKRLGEG